MRALIVLLLCAVLLLGCAGQEEAKEKTTEGAEQAAGKEVVKIGIIGPMDTKYGIAMERAARIAAEEINAEGGILGKKVEVITADTKFNPDTATSEFRRLASECDVVIGGFSSGVALSMLEVMAETKTLWLGDASSPRLTDKVAEDYEHYKYFFRPLVTNASTFPLDMADMLDFLNSKGMNIKKVAIIRDDALWTDDVMAVLKPLLEEKGYEIVMDAKVQKGTEDFTTLLLEAQEKADVIMPIIAHVKGVALVKQWAEMGMKIPIAGHDLSAIDPDFWDATEGKCYGEIYTADGGGVPTPLNEKMEHFLNAYKEKYGKLPEAYSAYGVYDAVYIYKAAVEKAAQAGESDPFNADTLIPYLESFNAENPFKGIRGNVAFTSNHDLTWGDGFVRNYICQWQDGKQVVVYPENIATGELITPWAE
ncbi:ABC transporter substrate-binding protein [Archaeoglobus veneficus]|uniref:Extracellular ligand-binding receptor n=1 Tax=Archaeoglobus veneficus (strain DSM 11195 / SNP6) TaxID=693661 RepID=F2KRS0_ARCVS|nr:ABC transporter substrate-binding protein [Archaeoglobus veneficus]AEA47934.1 Extracellular ligand-binding receptor [Archaeoglobus veneficus SNP6]